MTSQDHSRFDAEIWYPARCSPYEAFLEIGTGTDGFSAYLEGRKVTRHRRLGPDADLWAALEDGDFGQFDRVMLLDTLDPLPVEDAARLLAALRPRLNDSALVVVRVLNAASPWSRGGQYADLARRAAYTPSSLTQLAELAGFALEAHWPQHAACPRRRFTDALFHRLLTWVLADPPPLWSAHFYGILTPR